MNMRILIILLFITTICKAQMVNLVRTNNRYITQTWDATASNGAINNGSGTWDGFSQVTFTRNSGTSNAQFIPRCKVIFGGGSDACGTVTLNQNQSVEDMTFASGGSGNFTLSGAYTIANRSGNFTTNLDATINSVIAGTNGMTFSGANTLTFAGTNTVSGSIILNSSSKVTISGASGKLCSYSNGSPCNISNSGTLTLSSNTGFYGDINGSGSVVLSGGYDVAFYNRGTYSGGTTIIGGTTRVCGSSYSSNPFGLSSSTVTISTSSTIASNTGTNGGANTVPNPISISSTRTLNTDAGYGGVTYSGVVSGAGNFATVSTGTTTLSNTNTYTGTTTVGSNSTLLISGNLGGAGRSYSSVFTINGTLTYTNAQDQNFYGLACGTSSTLNKNTGAGILHLQRSGSSYFPKTVNINAGTVDYNGGYFATQVHNNGSIINVNSGGILMTSSAHALGGYYESGVPTINVNSGGTLSINQSQYIYIINIAGSTTVNGTGDLRANASGTSRINFTGSATMTNPMAVNYGNFTLDVASGYTGTLSGTGNYFNTNFYKTSAGTLLISGTMNASSGTMYIQAGTVSLGASQFIAPTIGYYITVANSSPTLSNSGNITLTSAPTFTGRIINIVITEIGTGIAYDALTWTGAETDVPTLQVNGVGVTSGVANANGTTVTFDSVNKRIRVTR